MSIEQTSNRPLIDLRMVDPKPLAWESGIHLPAGSLVLITSERSDKPSYHFTSTDLTGGNSPKGRLIGEENGSIFLIQDNARLITLHPASYLAQQGVPYIAFQYDSSDGQTHHTIHPIWDKVMVDFDENLAKKIIDQHILRAIREPFQSPATQTVLNNLIKHFKSASANPSEGKTSEDYQKAIELIKDLLK